MGQLSKNRINVLIAGKFLEILNEREEQELEEWLSANPENRNFYDRIMQAHDNNDRNKYLESLKIDERWIQLKAYWSILDYQQTKGSGSGNGMHHNPYPRFIQSHADHSRRQTIRTTGYFTTNYFKSTCPTDQRWKKIKL